VGELGRDGGGKGRGSASTPLEVPSDFSTVVAPTVPVVQCSSDATKTIFARSRQNRSGHHIIPI